MTVSIRVYVPKATPAKCKQNVCAYFTDKFGGCTTFNGRGKWRNPQTQEIISEPVEIIEVVCDPEKPATIAKNAAKIVKSNSNEDSVMWDIQPMETMGME
jgi:hypothetical protein